MDNESEPDLGDTRNNNSSTKLLEIKTQEKQLKTDFYAGLNKEIRSATFPKGAGFCGLISSSFCSPFPQRMRVGDGNCSAKKSKGCAIYQRYQAIKEYYPDDEKALEILAESDYISPIKRGD